MADDFDIYGDLDELTVETQTENKVIRELNAQIEELKAKIAEKEQEKQEIANKNAILMENISTLLLTAKAELKRKDALIADIRRERDNTVFRRGNKHVRKHDRYTQTTLIHHMDREVQTECLEEKRKIKDSTSVLRNDRRRDRSLSRQREISGTTRHIRGNSRSRDVFKRPNPISRMDLRNKIHSSCNRNREWQREKEKQARRANRTPDLDRKRSTVRFRSPVRVKDRKDGACQSDSYIELSSTFIPMNEEELDRYVKEIGRKENRAPANETIKEGKKSSKRTKSEPSGDIIQSDEIGTTASTGIGTPNGGLEDIEQKLTALHGESTPKTPRMNSSVAQTSMELLEYLNREDSSPPPLPPLPPPVIPPPPEPPIIEQVPEFPLDDDPRLNDSRELRIVESDEGPGPIESSEKHVEATLREEELEDGEVLSSGDEQTTQGVTNRVSDGNEVVDSSERKHTKKRNHTKKSKHKSVDKVEEKHDIDRSRPEERISLTQDHSRLKIKDRNHQRPRRLTEPSLEEWESVNSHTKNKIRHSHSNSHKEKTLKELFGTDDENSLCGSPIVVAKRRNSCELNGLEHAMKKQKRAAIAAAMELAVENRVTSERNHAGHREVEGHKHFSKERSNVGLDSQPEENKSILHKELTSQERADRKEHKHKHTESTLWQENRRKNGDDAERDRNHKVEHNVSSRKEHNSREAHFLVIEEHISQPPVDRHGMITRRRKSVRVEGSESSHKENTDRRRSANQEESAGKDGMLKKEVEVSEVDRKKEAERRCMLVENSKESVEERKTIKQDVTGKRRRSLHQNDARNVLEDSEAITGQKKSTIDETECGTKQIPKIVNINTEEDCDKICGKVEQDTLYRSKEHDKREASNYPTEEPDRLSLKDEHRKITKRRKSVRLLQSDLDQEKTTQKRRSTDREHSALEVEFTKEEVVCPPESSSQKDQEKEVESQSIFVQKDKSVKVIEPATEKQVVNNVEEGEKIKRRRKSIFSLHSDFDQEENSQRRRSFTNLEYSALELDTVENEICGKVEQKSPFSSKEHDKRKASIYSTGDPDRLLNDEPWKITKRRKSVRLLHSDLEQENTSHSVLEVESTKEEAICSRESSSQKDQEKEAESQSVLEEADKSEEVIELITEKQVVNGAEGRGKIKRRKKSIRLLHSASDQEESTQRISSTNREHSASEIDSTKEETVCPQESCLQKDEEKEAESQNILVEVDKSEVIEPATERLSVNVEDATVRRGRSGQDSAISEEMVLQETENSTLEPEGMAEHTVFDAVDDVENSNATVEPERETEKSSEQIQTSVPSALSEIVLPPTLSNPKEVTEEKASIVCVEESVRQEELVQAEDILVAQKQTIDEQIETEQMDKCDILLPIVAELPDHVTQLTPSTVERTEEHTITHAVDDASGRQLEAAESEHIESATTGQDTSILLGRYCEYRIAFDNEEETTVIITRKKKKKIKAKNATLNATGLVC
ncbi:uncharacterized protein LOC129721337 [Wyeomyia smithii]|uniref:uncharacterized protein LOC129721337 n=1 Tax=Wyeomyia smithii TaxID=174621 RepID=UPI002467EE43|nr:uncharacterized protein LOC129721337 [Wyeomyia smithii]